MKLVTLTHANLNVPVLINPQMIFSISYSKSNNCTHIVGMGAIVPVSETVDEVQRLICNMVSDGTKSNERK